MLMMDMELEPRVKPLTYKVKGMSRESPSQKALHVLDSDLRTHWSTATNTKEWLLLELEEPCLLSHIRIYNKSVLEWEIAVSLRYKPEAFVKVRPRCEAPRRDMIYPMNYTPCRYVRISCLRGSPIAIFFVQLIGVSVVGLEAEFQPLVNYLLPQIISHKQDAHDIYLQLLQDVTTKLLPFLPQLEADLENFSEAPESSIRFFAMLVGPLYPILWIVYEKEVARASGSASESDVLKHNQSTALLVSSNFEAQPRRSRSPSPYTQSVSSSVAFRRDTVFMLLRKAYKDSHLGSVCRVVCRAMQKLNGPTNSGEASIFSGGTCMVSEDSGKAESSSSQTDKADYSSLFGDEFKIPADNWDSCLLHVLDMGAVEEGMLHVLYACASEPFLCSKLAESSLEFWSALPLVQAMVPALRPACSHFDQFDDIFLQWKQPFVQRSLSQIVASLSSSLYRSLLDACAGYLSSFSQSHVKAACNLIDLCFGPLAPWISTVIAKIDLAIELLEDLVSAIQDVRHSASRARAALKYVLLALSGHMDDVLSKYKEAKHRLLFLIEMLEPFLDPAITISKNAIAFGDVSAIYMEKQERSCAASLNIIRTAVHRQTVLPSLELEWKHGNVAPSVLLSILGPHMDLPSDVDLCKYPDSKSTGSESFASSSGSLAFCHGTSAKSNGNDLSNGKIDTLEATADVDINEDAGLFFVPLELKNTILKNSGNISDGNCLEKNSSDSIPSDLTRGMKHLSEKILNNQFKTGLILDIGMPVEFFNLQADYLQLVNRQVCELKASEFQRLAHELHSQQELTPEGHDAAIDSLLLAAECYVNPFFFMSFGNSAKLSNVLNDSMDKIISRNYYRRDENTAVKQFKVRNNNDMTIIADLERRRDKIVLQIILQAASLDKEYHMNMSNGKNCYYETEEVINGIEVSPLDEPSMDAVTLVRHNQALLCHFIMRHLQRDQHSMHEVLMQCLLFLLHSATELICSSDDMVDVILRSAEQLNKLLTSLYYHIKEDNQQLNPEKVHQVQRRWVLLQRLVVASCGGDDRSSTIFTLDRVQYRNLVSPLSWLERISTFSSSALPLVRFLGWMAVSSYAKKLIKEHLYLVTEFSQLTCLLSIFTDELAIVDEFVLNKVDGFGLMHSEIKEDLLAGNGCGSHERASSERSFQLIYPDLQKFFPNMKRQFEAFGEVILEAVGLHLKYLPLRDIPDALCWLSDLCLWPFHGVADNIILNGISNSQPKGISAKNARAVILYVLETIVTEHMEAMVPETPRVVHILTALCRNSFCDVAFLDSVLQLLKPLISYALRKVYEDENLLSDESSCQNFESLCFKELFSNIAINPQGGISEEHYHGALVIFIIGSFFPDLSFLKRTEAFQSLMTWADFVSFEKTSSFHDYLFAFQKLMENCLEVLIQTFKNFGFCLASQKSQMLGVEATESPDDKVSSILDDLFSSLLSEVKKEFENTDNETHSSNERIRGLHVEEIKEFSTGLENLTLKLFPSLNRCWKLHPRLAKKLVITSSRCYLYCKCLCSIHQLITVEGNKDSPTAIFSILNDNISDHWKAALRNFLEVIMGFEQNHFWQIASIMLDYLLLLPLTIPVEQVVPTICSAMKNFCCHAPKISWRLQTDKWLFILFVRDIGSLEEDCSSLLELFSTMLSHAEPEQRSIAIQHLARVVRQGTNEKVKLSFALQNKSLTLDTDISFSESFLSDLVASTWDMVASVSSSDPSLVLRIRAAVLLLDCIPFAQQSQLQCFLCSYNKIFHGMEKVNHPMREGLLTRLSLALLGTACLYSSSEDIALIPQSVWENVEMLGKTKTEGSMGYLEKACQALCDLRNQGDAAKEALKEALSSTAAIEDRDPEFEKTRESILRVVANLTSAQSYIDFFAKKEDQDAMELEEAEIELELIHSEKRPQDLSRGLKDEALQYLNYPLSSFKEKENNRLELIKDSIHSLEKAKIREEVALRRQKKLHEMHIRRKYLEEAALQEAELLMEHDRERTSEIEREIERQRVLELERAKTRELRHNLEMERERQMQRELQRELEQAELGIRSSQRREFSSTTSSRPRERYREREVGRAGPDGSLRSSSRDREGDTTVQAGVALPTNLSTAMPTILTGSRSFTGQVSTILQSRERSEEHFGGFEDNFEGGRDLGDIGSMEEPELASAFEASPGGYALIHNKQGSRGSKSRQIIERRDRDGRREGKWERKHS